MNTKALGNENKNNEESFKEKARDYEVNSFSSDNFCIDKERLFLENKYINLVEETDIFNRKTVSYQANKNESIHNWLKYKEGFSSELVSILLEDFKINPNGLILDPFMGSGTTMLVSKMKGFNSIGFDILPLSEIAINAKNDVYLYDLNELDKILLEIKNIDMNFDNISNFSHLSITKGAFPEETEKELMFFSKWAEDSSYSVQAKNLIKLCIINILEQISYTAKDGQYLRWDYRSQKVIEGNKKRLEKGQEPFKTVLDKGVIPDVRNSLCNAFESIVNDVKYIQQANHEKNNKYQKFINGSVLFELPKIESEKIDAVITSPPYCNRYDYTRTYALELAYLGVTEKKIRELRQSLLTCTVENKTKINELLSYYKSIEREDDFNRIINTIRTNKVFNEINIALKQREENGEINNKGVLQMVEGYFTELAFTFFELYRTCKPGAKVAFVNDNVRYAGEIIPVDFLTTDIAESFGFKPVKIYILKQRKGNSSQQMKKFGRVALRKSITIWEKL